MKRSDKQAAKKNGMPSTVARRCQKGGIEAKDGPNHWRTTKSAASASGEAKATKLKRGQTPEEGRKAAIEKILDEIPRGLGGCATQASSGRHPEMARRQADAKEVRRPCEPGPRREGWILVLG